MLREIYLSIHNHPYTLHGRDPLEQFNGELKQRYARLYRSDTEYERWTSLFPKIG